MYKTRLFFESPSPWSLHWPNHQASCIQTCLQTQFLWSLIVLWCWGGSSTLQSTTYSHLTRTQLALQFQLEASVNHAPLNIGFIARQQYFSPVLQNQQQPFPLTQSYLIFCTSDCWNPFPDQLPFSLFPFWPLPLLALIYFTLSALSSISYSAPFNSLSWSLSSPHSPSLPNSFSPPHPNAPFLLISALIDFFLVKGLKD